MDKIVLPIILNDEGASSFIRDLNSAINLPEVTIDFRPIQWVRPFGTLLTAESFKKFVEIRRSTGLKTYYSDKEWLENKCSSAIAYLKYFGFFKYCGIDVGEAPNKKQHTSNYFPIREISTHSLKPLIGDDWRVKIESTCEELAELITIDLDAINFLKYGFREIIRNVFEHSNVESCSLMAQFWPNTGEIELAVADRGIGIHETLKDKYKTSSALESLENSLMPGISRNDVTKKTNNQWANTGFGLFVLSNVGKNYGQFTIISSGTYLSMRKEEKKTLVDNIFFNGTAVKIAVNKKHLEYFPNLLQKLIIEGEKDFEEKFGVKIRASGKSRKSLK